ncbi:MAG: AMP-binding protein [Bacteroidales bacterium]|nr:AMP-binding protein [Bacteroidales bacterium]
MYNLTQNENFILCFENSVKECWNKTALDDYNVSSITYGQLAEEIEKNILVWKAAGLKPGDKVTINAKSSAGWAKIFLSSQIGEFVSVQIFPGFTAEDTMNMVNHSETKILYTEKVIFDNLSIEAMPDLLAAIDIKTGDLLASRGNFAEVYAQREQLFSAAHPQGLTPEEISYPNRDLDSLAAIMYTSGSTGNPKGVMLTNRNLTANIYLIPRHFPYKREDNYVSVLPFAHIFGMVYDMLAPLCFGMHLIVLGLPPVPSYLKPALREFKPHVFFAVPLILTKLIEDTIGEFIHSKSGEAKLADYQNNPDFCEALATIFMKALGGNIGIFVTGGAAIPEHFERLFVEILKLPFVTGYGMTEAAPTICLGHKETYKLKECGEYIEECVDLKIDSEDPANIPGEILIKGHVLFSGYYKNEEATKAAFTEDGWFHTGDLATMDKDHSVFIVGRSKNMLLSPNGQNIYPEEIEVVLNAFKGVAESLIISRNDKLVALIVPDHNELGDIDAAGLRNLMDANIVALNKKIPSYSQVSSYELRFESFAKTPKGSIRRFMYE